MNIDQILAAFKNVRRVGDGRWIARCPVHQDKSPSLSLKVVDDDRVLMHCFAGCPTDQVLIAASLDWSDLFPPSSSLWQPQRRPDSQTTRRLEAEKQLREWASTTGRAIRDRIHLRHQLVTKGETLMGTKGREDRGWDLLALGYQGLSRLEWLADLLDSRTPEDWIQAQEFLGVHHDLH